MRCVSEEQGDCAFSAMISLILTVDDRSAATCPTMALLACDVVAAACRAFSIAACSR
jgi:hypothetical protein